MAMFDVGSNRTRILWAWGWAFLASFLFQAIAAVTGLAKVSSASLGIMYVIMLPSYLVGILAYHALGVEKPTDGHTRCGHCGYALTGLIDVRCPECGNQA